MTNQLYYRTLAFRELPTPSLVAKTIEQLTEDRETMMALLKEYQYALLKSEKNNARLREQLAQAKLAAVSTHMSLPSSPSASDTSLPTQDTRVALITQEVDSARCRQSQLLTLEKRRAFEATPRQRALSTTEHSELKVPSARPRTSSASDGSDTTTDELLLTNIHSIITTLCQNRRLLNSRTSFMRYFSSDQIEIRGHLKPQVDKVSKFFGQLKSEYSDSLAYQASNALIVFFVYYFAINKEGNQRDRASHLLTDSEVPDTRKPTYKQFRPSDASALFELLSDVDFDLKIPEIRSLEARQDDDSQSVDVGTYQTMHHTINAHQLKRQKSFNLKAVATEALTIFRKIDSNKKIKNKALHRCIALIFPKK